jgi:hypothetical protein
LALSNGTDPEPEVRPGGIFRGGEEAFAEVRVFEGALEALKSGGPVKLPSFTRTKRINT